MLIDSSRFLEAFCELAEQKNISKDRISEILSEAVTKSFVKEDPDAHVEVNIDLDKGTFEIQRLKKVVSDDQVEYDDFNEIPQKIACANGAHFEIGDTYKELIPLEKIDWSMATYVRQFFMQRLMELLNKAVAEEWVSRVGEVIVAEVEKIDEFTKAVVVNIGKTNGYVSKKNQIPNEKLIPGKQYKFVVEKVKEQSKDWPISLSRVSTKLVQHELALEIPEIADHQIKIEKIVRLPGFKTKLAISCDFAGIDPIGSCLGVQGARIKHVSSQLNGEKIDIVLWDADPIKLVINAVWPVRLVGVEIVSDKLKKTMTIIVKDEKDLSAIIGKAGKNIKLLTQLVEWGIDVVTKTQADAQNIAYVDCAPYYLRTPTDPLQRHAPKVNLNFVNTPNLTETPTNQMRSFTTIIKNESDIEVDVAAVSMKKEPKTEPEEVLVEPTLEAPVEVEAAPVSEPTASVETKPETNPEVKPEPEPEAKPPEPVVEVQPPKAPETKPNTVAETKENSKAKKRVNVHKKIDLSELTFEFVQSDENDS